MTINGLTAGGNAPIRERKNQLDTDSFLQLLITQLSGQDPYNAVDDKAMFEQMATLTGVQSTTEMRATMEMTRAQGLIGHKVDYTDPTTGEMKTGTVDKLTFSGNKVLLTVNGLQILTSDVYQDYGQAPK